MNANQILQIKSEIIENSKIHFAIGSDPKNRLEPLYSFYRDEFKDWQENQRNKNFEKDYIFSLIFYKKDEWVFAGVYKKLNVVKLKSNRYKYETELLNIGNDVIGKMVIKFKKKFRNSYTYLENYFNQFEIVEILRDKYSILPFEGYENVRISFDFLKTIISREVESWKTALSNVKGVYLISDKNNGKQYVGAAYGHQAFWERWKEYSITGHCSNKELERILIENGFEYANNLQFSILEIRSMNAKDDEIITRESFWKDVLLSREFGYNKN